MTIPIETKKEIVKLARKGLKVAEIKNKTGASSGSIYPILNEQGITLPKKREKNLSSKFYEDFLYQSSREREYFLGLTYAICDNGTAYRNSKMTWEVKQKKLITTVKKILKSGNTVNKDHGGEGGKYGRGSSYLTIGCERLSQILIDFGLHPDKKSRALPKISETNPHIHPDNLSHLVRGVSNGGFWVGVNSRELSTNTTIQFPSITLIRQLEDILIERAGVTRNDENRDRKNRLIYCHENSIKIHDFIYEDWDWIEEKGFYLPSKKDKFLNSQIFGHYDI